MSGKGKAARLSDPASGGLEDDVGRDKATDGKGGLISPPSASVVDRRPLLNALLDSVRRLITTYVRLPGDQAADSIALWVAHTHAITAAPTSPRLLLRSAEKGSGKTRTLEILQLLVPARCIFVNPSAATLYRLLKEGQETFLIDEVDTIFTGKQDVENKDLQALLNNGYRQGASVPRCVGEGSRQKVELFPVFGAVALASLRNLPDTTQSRCIVVNLLKRAPDEPLAPFRRRSVEPITEPLREALAFWGARYHDELAEARPVVPADIQDRAAELWEPLLAIAELAGGDWPDRARAAAIANVGMTEDLSTGVRLLDCIRVVFEDDKHRDLDRLTSVDLCAQLNQNEQWEWGGWNNGQGIGPRNLARELKRHRIEPTVIRLPSGRTPRGYHRVDFADAWRRQLGRDAPSSATGATSATPIRIPVADVADVAPVRGEGANGSRGPDLLFDDAYFAELAAVGAPAEEGD